MGCSPSFPSQHHRRRSRQVRNSSKPPLAPCEQGRLRTRPRRLGPAIFDLQQVLAGKLALKVSVGKELDDVELTHPDKDTLENAQASLQDMLSQAAQESNGTIPAKLNEHQERITSAMEGAGKKRQGNDGSFVDQPSHPAASPLSQPAPVPAPPPAAGGGACGTAGGPYTVPQGFDAAVAVDEATVRLPA
ncbi:unnamed protein product [Prorocentrum cordatum]|uniref:Uncharacterized protein n=1 Tax=Prorocentrum cordatum TaxID=2364126 RepID=A0ABN9PDP1_9DINO|nr:unnamed protein product [Polarella glacialis]